MAVGLRFRVSGIPEKAKNMQGLILACSYTLGTAARSHVTMQRIIDPDIPCNVQRIYTLAVFLFLIAMESLNCSFPAYSIVVFLRSPVVLPVVGWLSTFMPFEIKLEAQTYNPDLKCLAWV